MPTAIPLEEFDPGDLPSAESRGRAKTSSVAAEAEALERARLAGYEAGYQAGWDDAARSETEDQQRIGAEFSRNLKNLEFTFYEARAHVMHALEPLLAGMVEKVLPTLVSTTIGDTIVEELMPLASAAADSPIEIVIAPSCRAALEPLLQGAVAVSFTIVEEPSLPEGQVFLRSGDTEKHLDLDSAVARIGTAITDLYELKEKAFQNG